MNLSKERNECEAKAIDKNIEKLIETMIYYGASVQKENFEYVIRQFYNLIKKEYFDKMIELFPAEHIIRKVYQNVTNICFTQSLLSAFTKMSMWQIKKKASNWDFLDSNEAVTAFTKEISSMNINDMKQFIEENKNVLEEKTNRYNYLFMILYKMDAYIYRNKVIGYNSKNFFEHYNEENGKMSFVCDDYKNNLIRQIDLIEDYKFDVIVDEESTINEKCGYIHNLYNELIEIAEKNKDYDNAELYCKNYIKFLERYQNQYNTIELKENLRTIYNTCAGIIWDKEGKLNEEADKYECKAIALNTALAKENPKKLLDYYLAISINYWNMAIMYYDAYNAQKIEKQDKYIEFFKKAIYYREEINKIEEIEDIEIKIKNYYKLGEMNFYIKEEQKAQENFEKAIQICNENKEFSYLIDRIDKFLNSNTLEKIKNYKKIIYK